MATKMATVQIPASEAAKYEAAIKDLFGKMDRLHKQMQRDQADIEKSQRRTRAKLTELAELVR